MTAIAASTDHPGVRARTLVVDYLRPTAYEIGITFGLLAAYVLADAVLADNNLLLINQNGPYLFAATLLAAAFWMARVSPLAIWTPLFWYRISTAVFFGIGNVAHTWMNWYSLSYINEFHSITDADLEKSNIIVTGCHLGVLIAVLLGSSWTRPRGAQTPIESHRHLLKLAAIGSCVIGYSVKYFIILPAAYGVFGPVTEVVIPNLIGQLSLMAPPGLFLLALAARWEGRTYGTVAFLLLLSDIAVGCIGLTKYATLLPLLTYLLAFLFGRVTLPRAAIATAVLVVSFAVMQPMLEFGRTRVQQLYGDASGGTVMQRLDLLVEYWTQDTERDEQMQGALIRITYLNANAAAMELYDTGKAGTSVSAITWIFIPRILWPEKPIYAIGAEFTGAVMGIETTSSWMGYFGESYYNFGFWGMLLAFPIGAVLLLASRYACYVIETRRWLHLPGVFLGLTIGIQTDNSLVGATVNFVTLLLMHPVSSVVTTVLQSLIRGSRHPQGLPIQAGARPLGFAARGIATPVHRT